MKNYSVEEIKPSNLIEGGSMAATERELYRSATAYRAIAMYRDPIYHFGIRPSVFGIEETTPDNYSVMNL